VTLFGSYLGAMWATVRRDAAIFVSYRFRTVSQILGMLFSLTTFYYVARLVRPDAVGSRHQYFAFVVVGIVTVAILAAALTTSQNVRLELMQGNFERMLVSPLGPAGGIVSLALFPILYATVVAGVVLLVAVGVFSIPLNLAGVPGAVLVVGLAAVAFMSIGMVFVAMLLAFKSASGATWFISGIGLLGGAYFPIRLFPGWIRWVSEIQPFTPAVDLLRHQLVGTALVSPAWLEILRMGAFSAVLAPLSLAAVWLAVQWSRRRGTITEF
jgi:ABC-type multidrug transport system permease subunit